MREVGVVGLDLAKHVFQVHGVDAQGRVVVRRRLRRGQVLGYFARLPPCRIGMEACGSAHDWARQLRRLGHDARLIAPQYVRPFRKGCKNDGNDAEAICEAVQRPNMRFVAVRAPEAQAVLHLHRGRELVVRQRVALESQVRAMLAEDGVVLPRGRGRVMGRVAELVEDGGNALPMLLRPGLVVLKEAYEALGRQIEELERRIRSWHERNGRSRLLETMPGVGYLTATALLAKVGDAGAFANGRHLAAWLGLVPGQGSSGGRERLLGITRRGDGYLRRLLVQGARAVVLHERRRMRAGRRPRDRWVAELLERKHFHVVVVAVANKMARTAWALLVRGESWRAPQAVVA